MGTKKDRLLCLSSSTTKPFVVLHDVKLSNKRVPFFAYLLSSNNCCFVKRYLSIRRRG